MTTKIKYLHYNIPIDPYAPEYATWWIAYDKDEYKPPYHAKESEEYFETYPAPARATVAILIQPREQCYQVGVALCGPLDNFCKKTGRELALERLENKDSWCYVEVAVEADLFLIGEIAIQKVIGGLQTYKSTIDHREYHTRWYNWALIDNAIYPRGRQRKQKKDKSDEENRV